MITECAMCGGACSEYGSIMSGEGVLYCSRECRAGGLVPNVLSALVERAEQHQASKDAGAKPMMSLLPWDVLREVAYLLTNDGAEKHPLEWRRPDRDSTADLDAALRHLTECVTGNKTDDDSGQPHIIHACARLLMYAWNETEADNGQ